MADCLQGIYSNIINECQDATGVGLEVTMYVFNRLDVESKTFDGVDSYMVTDITLSSGSTAFKIVGTKIANTASYSFVAKELSNDKYSHQVNLNVSKQDASTMEQLDSLGDVVVIVETKAKSTGNGQFKIFGLGFGLWPIEGAWNSGENEALHTLALASQEGSEELTRNLLFWDTDEATTRAKLEALLV